MVTDQSDSTRHTSFGVVLIEHGVNINVCLGLGHERDLLLLLAILLKWIWDGCECGHTTVGWHTFDFLALALELQEHLLNAGLNSVQRRVVVLLEDDLCHSVR
jgi:hypothetical protein